MTSRTIALVGLALIAFAAVQAAGAAPDDGLDLALQALEATEGSSISGWAYTETKIENGQVRISRFDPRLPTGEQWTLVSVDGRHPTEEELSEEAERRSSEQESSDSSGTGDDESVEINAMIESDSLSLIEETEAYAQYRFEPASDDDDDAELYRNLDATLKVVKAGPYVASVDMRSRGPFKPRFGVKINEFVTTLTFEPVTAGGAILPRTVTVRILGRAFLFKKISETVQVTYSDYEHVGE